VEMKLVEEEGTERRPSAIEPSCVEPLYCGVRESSTPGGMVVDDDDDDVELAAFGGREVLVVEGVGNTIDTLRAGGLDIRSMGS